MQTLEEHLRDYGNIPEVVDEPWGDLLNGFTHEKVDGTDDVILSGDEPMFRKCSWCRTDIADMKRETAEVSANG